MTRAIKKFSNSIISTSFSHSLREYFSCFMKKQKKKKILLKNFKHEDAGEHIASDINKTCKIRCHKELYCVVKFMDICEFSVWMKFGEGNGGV
jgi:hypothetical protein